MPSPILARADALMQRRRQNIGEIDDVPVLTDAVDEIETAEPFEEDDDFPVLMDAEIDELPEAAEPFISEAIAVEPEIVAAEPVLTSAPTLTEQTSPSLDAGIRDILAHELARRVEQRLMAELPRLIESTVKDFLAEQEMIAALQPQDR